jgi:hypothetical protein
MSFYTVIKTKLKNKKYIIAALAEMKQKGELLKCVENEKKGTIEIDRDGDAITISQDKKGDFQVAGDNRVVQSFSNRLKQAYALESIKDNIPLDFEVAEEQETAAGEILILLKD